MDMIKLQTAGKKRTKENRGPTKLMPAHVYGKELCEMMQGASLSWKLQKKRGVILYSSKYNI